MLECRDLLTAGFRMTIAENSYSMALVSRVIQMTEGNCSRQPLITSRD
jgi:hypothetical protein